MIHFVLFGLGCALAVVAMSAFQEKPPKHEISGAAFEAFMFSSTVAQENLKYCAMPEPAGGISTRVRSSKEILPLSETIYAMSMEKNTALSRPKLAVGLKSASVTLRQDKDAIIASIFLSSETTSETHLLRLHQGETGAINSQLIRSQGKPFGYGLFRPAQFGWRVRKN